MRPLLALLPAVALLGACSDVQHLGATAIEQRRTMNDLQARATMAATCDIALGAYFRELSPIERSYAGAVCGGLGSGLTSDLPQRLERAGLVSP